MAKNITVVDAMQNVYGNTYPKRARGLVKKGRARFVGKNIILMLLQTCKKEEICMDITDIRTDNVEQETGEQQDICILEKIDQIIKEASYVTSGIQQLEHLDEAGCQAVLNSIEQREQTNRCVIGLLTEMQKEAAFRSRTEAIQKLTDSIINSTINDEAKVESIREILNNMSK